MKLSFSTNAFVKNSLTYAIKSVASFGYEGIEIVADSPHAFLPLSESQVRTIKKNLKQNKLAVANLNANTVAGWHKKNPLTGYFEPSLSNTNEKLRRWRIKYTKQAIDLAAELESPSISITSGVLLPSKKQKNRYYFEQSLDEVATHAEKKDVLVGIEYEPGLLIGNSNDLLQFVSKQKNVGLNFDTCHAAVLGENLTKITRRFAQKLFHIHISDCKNSTHYHLIPGYGCINFKSMIRSLQKINYNGFLTAELYTYSDCPKYAAEITYKYLKTLVK